MKKLFLFICAILLSTSIFALEWQETVYLKNGNVIRGFIIEQVPNETIKIQSADGSIFVYKFEEVKKIAKEQKTPPKKDSERKKYPNRGYRGFVSGSYITSSDVEGFSLSTIHGVQILPRLYLGSGLELQDVNYLDLKHFSKGDGGVFLNAFDYIRCDIVKSKITPFADLRLGLRFGDDIDIYFSPSVGCRFGHVNLSMAYDEIPYCGYSGYSAYVGYYGALVIQLAFDFGSR